MVLAAEAAASTGLGHFVRCCALGDAAQRRGWEVSFVLRPDAVDWARAEVTSRNWALTSGELDPEVLTEVVRRGGQPEDAVLVLDSYLVQATCFTQMRSRVGRLLVIDDIADRYLDADVVVNQNLGASALSPRLGSGTTLLAGPSYALLRPEFIALRQTALEAVNELPDVPGHILVMIGGTDPTGSAVKVASACLTAFPDATVEVVVPGAVRPRTTGRLTELPRLQHVAQHMVKADLVVTAAGSTIWELCCLARPVAALEMAGNQSDVYRRLVAERLVLGLGKPPIDEVTLVAALRSLTGAPGELRRLATVVARLVDGRGADSVLDRI